MVIGVILSVIAIYYYWWLAVFLGMVAVSAYRIMRKEKRRQEFVAQQWAESLRNSVIFIMRKSLKGVALPFGLPDNESLGFSRIEERRSESGVIGFCLYYHRTINAPALDKRTKEQLRLMLNSEINVVSEKLVYDHGAFYVPLYVGEVYEDDWKLRFEVLPLTSDMAYKVADEHYQVKVKAEMAGFDNGGKSDIGRGDLIDDEVLPDVEETKPVENSEVTL